MNRVIMLISLVILLGILAGCQNQYVDKDVEEWEGNPPQMLLKYLGKTHETELGAYCWDLAENSTKCVDAVVPDETEKPLVVKASEQLTMELERGLKPDSQMLKQKNGDSWIEVSLIENQFTVPSTKGVYVYNYEVEWKGDNNDIKGNIVYGFILDVK